MLRKPLPRSWLVPGAVLLLLVWAALMVPVAQGQTPPAWQPNTSFAIGNLVTFNGVIFRCIQAHTSQVGWEPPNVPALWSPQSGAPSPTPTPTATPRPSPTPTPNPTPTPTPPPNVQPWAPNTFFSVGAVVSFNGGVFQCRQSHTSQVGWEPPNVPALWMVVSTPNPSPTPRPSPTPLPTPTPNPTPTPTPPPPPPPSNGFPGRVFAPYVDVLLGDFDAFKLAGNSGNVSRFYTLAFIVSFGCEARWGGIIPLSQDGPLAADIAALRAQGGDVIISFGGASGIELAQACTDENALLAQYQAVVSRYNARWIDFDIEGAAVADVASRSRRAKALGRLKAQNPNLRIAYTLPVLQTGLTDGFDLLNTVDADGKIVFVPDVVNIMAMDYGGAVADMGQAAISAIDSTVGQLQTIFGFTQAQARARMGVTPMIGRNDVAGETFQLTDAPRLVAAAQSRGIKLIAMWSANRDHSCDASGGALFQCSQITQQQFEFSRSFRAFTQ